jgi:hypothetical protein
MFSADIFIGWRVPPDPESARALPSVRPGPRQISFRKDEANNVELCKYHGGCFKQGVARISISLLCRDVVSTGGGIFAMDAIEPSNSALVICTITQTTTHIR